jgi:tetratricopeptide (TPR) repeat protein
VAWSLVAVAVVAGAARALYLAELRGALVLDVLIGDARAYDAWGARIAGGDWLGSDVFYQAPLYPYFLGVLYALGGHVPWIARVVQAVLGTGSCVLLACAGRRFFSLRVGVIAGLLLALYPPAIFFDGLLQKAALELFLMTLLLALLGEFLERRRWSWIAAAGVALGALLLSRENARLLHPVLAAWLWLSFGDQPARRCLGWIAAFTAGVALVVLPVALRNRAVGGELVLTTAQLGPNFYIGNHAGASGLYEPLRPLHGDPMYEREDATALAAEALGHAPSPSEVSDYWLGRTLEDIATAPLAWLRLLTWKWLLTWNAREIADSEGMAVYAAHAALLRAAGALLGFGVLCPLAALGAWATRRDWRRLVVLYALLLTSALSIALFFVFARYRLTIVPLVTLFAAAGLEAAFAALATRRAAALAPLAPGLLAAGAVALLVDRPLIAQRDEQLSYFNLATALIDAGRPGDAIAPLEHAIALEPGFAAAHLNLGRALLAEHRTDDAAASFARAAEVDPQMALAHFDLALARIEQNREDEADAELASALALDPQIARAQLLLGRRLLARGRGADAVTHLREAVRLDPLDAPSHRDLALAYLSLGDAAAATAELRETLRLAPDAHGAAVRLAWLLATSDDDRVRDGAQAVALAELVVRAVGPDDPVLLDTLAAAYAEVGRYAEAVELAQHAAGTARRVGNPVLGDAIDLRARGYASGKPYREAARATAR